MRLSVNRRQYSSSRGDTIVEVMIAIAVVAVVLAGAYVTTNRSLQATRAAEERSIALKLAESQIEQIKGLMTTSAGVAAVQNVSSPFCILPNGQPSPRSGTICDFSTAGANNNGAEPVFHISITKPSANNFVLTVQWYDVGGRDQDSLQLRYRVYG